MSGATVVPSRTPITVLPEPSGLAIIVSFTTPIRTYDVKIDIPLMIIPSSGTIHSPAVNCSVLQSNGQYIIDQHNPWRCSSVR